LHKVEVSDAFRLREIRKHSTETDRLSDRQPRPHDKQLYWTDQWLSVVKRDVQGSKNNYNVGHKKRDTFIFVTTMANIDRFS